VINTFLSANRLTKENLKSWFPVFHFIIEPNSSQNKPGTASSAGLGSQHCYDSDITRCCRCAGFYWTNMLSI